MTEDEMVGWLPPLKDEFEQILGNREGQGTLACCNPWGCKELDMNYQLINNNNNKITGHVYFPWSLQVF